jgi:hypothetical protein
LKEDAMANRIARAPKAPRERQPATRRAEAKAPAKTTVSAAQPAMITAGERYRLIAEAAYLIAEQRGFAAGRELEDWLEAEAIVTARLQRNTR